MHKRGQVTVFIILGIVILVLFGLLMFLRGDILQGDVDTVTGRSFTSADIEPVKDVVSECVEVSLLKGIEHVSNRGGYFDPVSSDDYSRDVNGVNVVYSWSFENGNRVPSLSLLGRQVNFYLEENREDIIACIDEGLGDYKRQWNIQNWDAFILDEPHVSERFVRQIVRFPLDAPLTVDKGNEYFGEAREVVSELDIALGQAQRLAADIVSCYNGDYNSIIYSEYNSYCNQDGVAFRTELYNMRYYRNVVKSNHQNCGDDCNQCYTLFIPAPERDDIVYNVGMKTC